MNFAGAERSFIAAPRLCDMSSMLNPAANIIMPSESSRAARLREQKSRVRGNATVELDTQKLDDHILANLAGRLDGSNARKFEESLKETIGTDSRPVIIDMKNLSYISSAGLRAILLIAKSVKARKADLALCSLPSHINEIFEISGFDKIIPIHSTREAATKSLAG